MTHGSLFSGIGGFDLASEWMGWENVFHCEINKYVNKTLKYYWSNAISYGDITKTDFTIWRGKIDILTGGFPCQNISILNTKKEGIKGKKSGLWEHFARAIWEIRPKYIVFENSPMLISRGFERVLCDLSRMGYDTEWRMFFASEFGFPHHRKRLYGLSYPSGLGHKSSINKIGLLHQIIPDKNEKRGYENSKAYLSLPLIRINKQTDFDSLQLCDGFSKELDKESIEAFGNAVLPQIPYQIFKAIEAFNNTKL